MTLVTEADQKRIADAITEAERKTSGEIVAVIAPVSSQYLHAPFLWAALVALAVPWPFVFWTWWPIQHIYVLQLTVFAVLVAVLTRQPVRLALVPRRIKHARAHRRAVEQFLAQNLHTTAGRTGVMIFVSAGERYAEIVADAGINAKVEPAAWQDAVDAMIAAIKARRAADGFVTAVERCGALLARHFPPGAINRDELPNKLIVM
jgi:putative membrane protein